MTRRESDPPDETVIQDEDERARSKGRSEELPPPEVPGYEIQRRLGSGSYGEVWLAVQKNTRRQVAIKFFSKFQGLDWPLLKREVGKLLEVLGERRVVHLLQVGWDADPPYYVMEYLPGGSLADKLAGRTFPVDEAVSVFGEIAEALVYLHGKAILHCDLKPANVLLDDHGQIRLADFGQARLTSEGGPAMGTLFYMAPEQAAPGARPDVRSDIYSLGALVYTMLTGTPPYSSERANRELSTSNSTKERIERYRKIIESSEPPKAHHDVEGMDGALAEILDRCLEKNPDERYENVTEVLRALSLRDKQRTRRPLVVLGLLGPLALLLSMAAVGIFTWYQAETEAARTLTQQNLESAAGYAELIAAVVDRNISAAKRRVRREAEDDALGRLLLARSSSKLQAHVERLYEAYRDSFFHNWVVADADAVVLARAPFDDRVVGSRYAYREWFTGFEDIPKDQAPSRASPRRESGLTLAFESTAHGNPILVSVASPIRVEGKISGVLMATLHLDTFNQWLEEAEGPKGESGCPPRFAVLLNRGQLVRHPCPAPDAPALPIDREGYFELAAVQSLLGSDTRLEVAFEDPLRDGEAYLAAHETFRDNTDWIAVVEHDRAHAMLPVTNLIERFTVLAWLAGGAAVLLVISLWFLLYRVTRERPDHEERAGILRLGR